MTREQTQTATVNCSRCGSKFGVTRARCPRCRTPIAQPGVAAQSTPTRRLPGIVAAVALLFVVGCTGIFLMQPASDAAQVIVNPPDPLAWRRPPAPVEEVEAEPEAAGQVSRRSAFEPGIEGIEAYHKGDLEGALEPLRAAVEEYPEDAEARSALGQVLVSLGRFDEALLHLQDAVALSPGRWAYQAAVGRAYAHLGRWDDAIASYREAQALFADDSETTLNLAEALEQAGERAAAIEEYKRAVTLEPANASLRMTLGMAHERLEQHEAAASAYEEYLRLSSGGADADRLRIRIAQLRSNNTRSQNSYNPTYHATI
jgi:Flp pilus assembly protein TadD